MRGIRQPFLLACAVCSLQPAVASAGMPSVSFTEVARLRLEVISFFLVGLLLSAGALQLIWYWLRRDFTWLPKLGYFGSLGIVVLWGLLFVVVLTMISGARELMTPGAWEKDGATYKLSKPAEKTDDAPPIAARSIHLLSLGNALRQWAEKNDNQLPTAAQVSEINESLWSVPDLPGTRYLYVPGVTLADQKRIIAYEPQVSRGDALAVTAGGELVQLPYEKLLARVRTERAAATAPASTSPTPNAAEDTP
jgi:hypothetical protein